MKRFLTLVAVFAVAAALTTSAGANPVEWEQETVESLLINDEGRVVFVYDAAPVSCVNSQGFTQFDDCPSIKWLCPQGITHGALNRLAREVSYDRAILGFAARDTMCLATGVMSVTPNPQLPDSVPIDAAVPVIVTQPVPAFTG